MHAACPQCLRKGVGKDALEELDWFVAACWAGESLPYRGELPVFLRERRVEATIDLNRVEAPREGDARESLAVKAHGEVAAVRLRRVDAARDPHPLHVGAAAKRARRKQHPNAEVIVRRSVAAHLWRRGHCSNTLDPHVRGHERGRGEVYDKGNVTVGNVCSKAGREAIGHLEVLDAR